MEMCSLGLDLKPDAEPANTICRCCLSKSQRMHNVLQYSQQILDLAGISVSPLDGLPRWLCPECAMLLEKSVRFKHKVVRAHNTLYGYLSRCAPFPIDPHDPELSKYASPHLNVVDVLAFDTHGRGKNGFHKVLAHKSKALKYEYSVEIVDTVKVENGFSDYEDNIPLDAYKTNMDSDAIDDAVASLLGDIKTTSEPLLEEVDGSKRKKSKKKEAKVKKRKKVKEQIQDEEDVKAKTLSIRKPVEIDPTKIREIILNPEEQVKQREEESRTGLGYLKLPYKCSLCFKGFNFESKLSNHMKKHSPSRGKYECTLCRMYLPTQYSYNTHMVIHTRRYECLKCGRRMTDRASIVEHYRAQHEGIVTQYTCQLCGKLSSNNKTHRGHMRNHHGAARPACDRCGKTFVNKDSLAEHILIHQGVKNYECPQCGKRFRTKTQVKHHQLKHSNSKEYYCVECDVRFKSAHNLRQHLLKSLKHKDSQSFPHACAKCPKRFENSAVLARHTAVQHEGERAHACGECGARLASKNSLAKHARAHAGLRAPARHVCHACGRAFRGKSVLVNHMRTHTGEKPFACGECGRRFTQRTAMRTHLKLVHLKVKRNTKIKLDEMAADAEPDVKVKPREALVESEMSIPLEVKMLPVTKEEEPVYDAWRHQQLPCDVYFTAP